MKKIFLFMLIRTLKRLHYINTSSVFTFLSDTMSDLNSFKSVKHLFLSVIARWPTLICSPVYTNTLRFNRNCLNEVCGSCLNFKMSKFTLQLNQSYKHFQISQTMSSRLQRRIQNSDKHLRWSVLRKRLTAL